MSKTFLMKDLYTAGVDAFLNEESPNTADTIISAVKRIDNPENGLSETDRLLFNALGTHMTVANDLGFSSLTVKRHLPEGPIGELVGESLMYFGFECEEIQEQLASVTVAKKFTNSIDNFFTKYRDVAAEVNARKGDLAPQELILAYYNSVHPNLGMRGLAQLVSSLAVTLYVNGYIVSNYRISQDAGIDVAVMELTNGGDTVRIHFSGAAMARVLNYLDPMDDKPMDHRIELPEDDYLKSLK